MAGRRISGITRIAAVASVALAVALSACGRPVPVAPLAGSAASVVAEASARPAGPQYRLELDERSSQAVEGGTSGAAVRLSAAEALPGDLVELQGVPVGSGTVRLNLAFPGGEMRRVYLTRVSPVRVAMVVPLPPATYSADVEAVGRLTAGSAAYAEFPITIRALPGDGDDLSGIPAAAGEALATAVGGSGLAPLADYLSGIGGSLAADAAGTFPEAAGHAAIMSRLSKAVGYRAAASSYLDALGGNLALVPGLLAQDTFTAEMLEHVARWRRGLDEIDRTRLPEVADRYQRMVLAAGDERANGCPRPGDHQPRAADPVPRDRQPGAGQLRARAGGLRARPRRGPCRVQPGRRGVRLRQDRA